MLLSLQVELFPSQGKCTVEKQHRHDVRMSKLCSGKSLSPFQALCCKTNSGPSLSWSFIAGSSHDSEYSFKREDMERSKNEADKKLQDESCRPKTVPQFGKLENFSFKSKTNLSSSQVASLGKSFWKSPSE